MFFVYSLFHDITLGTPRIEKLAQPSFSAREAKKHDEDKYDPWIISPTALKYKPSARILELAKPLERD
jgi:hypothetical protein